MKKVNPLTIKDVEYLAHKLAKRYLEFDAKIPDFSTRSPNILESCLATPFQTFNKKDLYPGLNKKAAMLFYLMNKNHPFQNGNKRVAVTSLFIFLYAKNSKWLEVSLDKLYQLAVWVAESNPEYKDGVLIAIEEFIAKYSRDLTRRELASMVYHKKND